jgi:hypothetical protein
MKMESKKILISINELSYSSELAIQTNIAEQYSNLEKQLPDYCKKPFSNYVTDSEQYIIDFKNHCENEIQMSIPIGKKMELVNENWFQYRDKLDELHKRMNENLMFSNEINNSELTASAKNKLKEKHSTYAEGKNIEIYNLAKHCQDKLNELNLLLKSNDRVAMYQFSQFSPRTFKRSGDYIEFDMTALLY